MRSPHGLLAVLIALALAAPSRAADKADVDKLNKKIDFSLKTADDKTFDLAQLKDRKAVVVLFLSFDCPVSNSYSPTLIELHKAYADKGIVFVGVDASDDLSAAELLEKAKEYKLPFAVLKDAKFAAADAFQAKTSPEAFVLDHNLILRYRGRIDNAYSARLKKNNKVTEHDLKGALDDLLAGKDVRTPATKAIGCPIQRERVVKKDGKVTYHRDVLPILQTHCQGCHRPGEVGPFSLMTYKQAVNWASDVKEYTQSRRMPPWKPSADSVSFHNERRLSDRELKTIADWVDGDTPEGDPKDAPKAKEFTEGWQLGKPDLVLSVGEDMVVGPSGKDLFRVFVMPTNLKEDRYVVAVEVRPGNKRIVHHTLNFFDTTGQARALAKKESDRAKGKDEQDRGPGYSASMGIGFVPTPGKIGGLGGWAPGQMARKLPDGYGFRLPAGSDLVVQTHYHRNGRTEKDRLTIGLYFAEAKKEIKPFKAAVVPGLFLAVPAGNDNFKVSGTIECLDEGELRSVMPHMHLLGKKIKLTMTEPEGKPKTLIDVREWDYNWQETYFLKKPIAVKKGTKFTVEAAYDNSDKNPNNPFSPPKQVRFGEQTDNEMCFVFLGLTNAASGERFRTRFEGLNFLRPKDEKKDDKKEK
jgi:thiol-disulfide isomerase/thioredoxin